MDDVDDITDSSATLNGAAIGRVSVGGIVGNSGTSVIGFGGRRRRYVDTDVAVRVDGRGSSITTTYTILIVVSHFRRSIYFTLDTLRRRYSTPVSTQLP